jgi:hypothetical protein
MTLQGGKNGFARGVACRDKSGTWHTRLYVPSPPEALAYRPSADYVPASADDLLDDVLADLMAAPPLTPEQEAELIRNAWP